MNEAIKSDLYIGIYTGSYNLYKLPQPVFEYTFQELWDGIEKGYHLKYEKAVFGSENYNLLTQFKKNINVFSGAKTFQQLKDSQNFILDAEGKLRPFNDYLKDVKEINALYNEIWLQVERDIAVKMAQSSRQWLDIVAQSEDLPFLQYVTVKDERVRPEHRKLDGIIRAVNDSFWNIFMPPIDWGCRCDVIQLEKDRESKISEDEMKNYKSIVPPLFRMNPAKDGYIFKMEGIGSHPYFKVGEAFEVMKNVNFLLPEL